MLPPILLPVGNKFEALAHKLLTHAQCQRQGCTTKVNRAVLPQILPGTPKTALERGLEVGEPYEFSGVQKRAVVFLQGFKANDRQFTPNIKAGCKIRESKVYCWFSRLPETGSQGLNVMDKNNTFNDHIWPPLLPTQTEQQSSSVQALSRLYPPVHHKRTVFEDKQAACVAHAHSPCGSSVQALQDKQPLTDSIKGSQEAPATHSR